MMTRTCAEDLAKHGIYMNSVDTGWINDENPLPTAQRIAEAHGFQTPIDEVDAAARIIDPVLTGLACAAKADAARAATETVTEADGARRLAGRGRAGQGPPWGCFLKDYVQSDLASASLGVFFFYLVLLRLLRFISPFRCPLPRPRSGDQKCPTLHTATTQSAARASKSLAPGLPFRRQRSQSGKVLENQVHASERPVWLRHRTAQGRCPGWSLNSMHFGM